MTTGTIPSTLGSLTLLKELRLGHNILTGMCIYLNINASIYNDIQYMINIYMYRHIYINIYI
jgi:hypothetical protein